MTRCIGLCLGFALIWSAAAAAQPAPAKPVSRPEPPKGTEVVLDGVKAVTPSSWKAEKPANRLRSHQFKLSKALGDKEDAELFILPEVGGKVEDEFDRLRDLFIPPPDMPKSQAAKQSKFTVGKATLHVLDLQGTFRVKHIPIDQAVKEVKPDYRMVAVIWKSDQTSCSIRLVGPKRTVEAHAKEFESWLKSFK
jgi:hypothetical protein